MSMRLKRRIGSPGILNGIGSTPNAFFHGHTVGENDLAPGRVRRNVGDVRSKDVRRGLLDEPCALPFGLGGFVGAAGFFLFLNPADESPVANRKDESVHERSVRR